LRRNVGNINFLHILSFHSSNIFMKRKYKVMNVVCIKFSIYIETFDA
jgi:hypothetical protein